MVALLEYHAMAPQKDAEKFEWEYLIRPDKSPSRQLEQLCLGIANIIVSALHFVPCNDERADRILQSKLKSSTPGEGITPERVAAFYRAVGGNYDTLFLSTPNSSLSFIYQSLGCFHTLQPSSNAFEPPCIPTLLPHGFVRWQTIQLLLCPDEHSGFLREAVKHFDVVNPSTGRVFPKDIPRNVFPAEPDDEMVKWHDTVGKRLEQEYEASQARKAAQQQPREPELPPKGADPARPTPSSEKTPTHDYFSHHHQHPNASKTTRPTSSSRGNSHEACSPFTRPSHGTEPVDDPSELDADINRAYRHVDPEEVDRTHTCRTSSRQSRTRGRSRTPSRRHHSSRRRHKSKTHDPVESSDYSLSFTDDEDEEEDGRYTRTRRPPSSSRRHASHSIDGRPLRGFHTRLLSPERNAGRRHSHDSPLSKSRSKTRPSVRPRHRSGSPSPYRRSHPPSNLHQRIQVEIIPSDTDLGTETELETENETDTDPYHSLRPHQVHERELDGESDDYNDDPAENYTPDTKRARDFYYARNHSRPRSRGRKHNGPEYIVLPTSAHGTTSSGGSNPSTSTTTSPSTAPGSTSPRASRTPSKPIKYKEYILIEPETPRSPPPSMPSFTAPVYTTHAQPRRPASRSRKIYVGGGGGGGGSGTHTPITITTQVPASSMNRKPSRSGRWGSHNASMSGSSGSHNLRGTRYGC